MSDSKELWELGQVKGRQDERERIIKLLETHRAGFAVLRGSGQIENLADTFIALIKGENTCKHERTLDWGQHCDCGTRHRDCRDCDWTEPCESEGENK